MKNYRIKFAGALFMVLLVGLMMMPENAVAQDQGQTVKKDAIPENVMTILTQSCMDCHSEGGNRLAMIHVNLSKWEKLSPSKKAKKSAAICKIMTKGKMPPESYASAKPDAAPTPAQIKQVCSWSETLKSKRCP